MTNALPYVVFAFAVAMGGMAAYSMLKSPEERWYRESFLYNYGIVFAYGILSIIGLLIMYQMYVSGVLVNMTAVTVLDPGFKDFLGPYVGYVGARIAAKHVTEHVRDSGILPQFGGPPTEAPQEQPSAQKQYRRQIGHGRYHT